MPSIRIIKVYHHYPLKYFFGIAGIPAENQTWCRSPDARDSRCDTVLSITADVSVY